MRWFAALVAAATLGHALPSHATQYIETITGTVTSPFFTNENLDQSGLFGVSGADLTSDSFKLQIVYDPANGDVNYCCNGNGYYMYFYSATSSMSATYVGMTINGVTQNYRTGLLNGLVAAGYNQSQNFDFIQTNLYNGTGSSFFINGDSTGGGVPLDPNSTYSFAMTNTGGSSYRIFIPGYDQVILNLLPTYVTVAVTDGTFPSSVPEPATWAMLILGLFGLGASLRRRAHDQAAAIDA